MCLLQVEFLSAAMSIKHFSSNNWEVHALIEIGGKLITVKLGNISPAKSLVKLKYLTHSTALSQVKIHLP